MLVGPGSDEQIFGAMNPGRGRSDQEAFGSTRCCRAGRAEFYFEPFCQLALAVNGWGNFPSMAPMHSRDQMKPRTVYEKAVQDFTETARRLARLDQHFRQASFAEFKMLMDVR